MNICFFSDARAEHTRRWSKYFALKGHHVDIITWNPNTLDNYEPVQVHVVHKTLASSNILSRILNLPYLIAEIKKIIREIKPDVIHAHSAGAYAWMAMLAGFHPYVVTPWGTDILVDAKKSRWNHWLTSFALRRADLITCDARHMKNEIVCLGVNPDRIQLVMFGVDLNRFVVSPDAGIEFKKRFKLNDSPIVLSTRTLTPIHDVETFVRAIPLIQAAVPDAQFIVATDGSERNKLEDMADALGVTEAVRFPGYLEEDEMVRWLCLADVYVSTSLTDAGLAGSTAEAMACGLPVVITDNGENSDWVIDGKGGYLVPNGASDMLAERVIRLSKDKNMCLKFGHVNRQIIEERNNYVTEMDRMEVMYEELARHAK
jgi:glycosyltransferase involved in cell wall biosynthesis